MKKYNQTLVDICIKFKKTSVKKLGFTLAEVLITLGIIGVVAEMTIPTLMNNVGNQVYKTSYKKAYSELSQALMQANTDEVLNSASGHYDPVHLANFKAVMSYFKIIKTCDDQVDNSACWNNNGEEWNSSGVSNGWPAPYDVVDIVASGESWSIVCLGYAAIYVVDTNGMKKPNQMGKDRFVFTLRDSTGTEDTGIPIKIDPYPDNGWICWNNKCGNPASQDYNTYFGTSWLYN